MCDGIVIDGHIIRDFRDQLVQKSGVIYSLISWITANCGIAISEYTRTHWEQHCGTREKSLLFWEWYFDQLHNKRTIHFTKVRRFDGKTWKAIQNKFRIPKDPFVRTAIECANSTAEPRYILAVDMLFYEPVSKRSETVTQLDIREKRNGDLCKYLESCYHIIVGSPNHCKGYFEINKGVCSNNSLNHPNNCPRISTK